VITNEGMGACLDNPLGPDPGVSWKWEDPVPSTGCPGPGLGGASASAGRRSRAAVRATVRGRGRRRTLRFRLPRVAGQRVTFAEQGRRVYRTIGSTTKGHGALAFRPAAGPGGRRAIVAVVEQGHVPYEELAIAHYRAPPTPRLQRPRHVDVRRRGRKMAIGWAPVGGARGYRVRVDLPRDGRRLLYFPAPKKHGLRVRGVERSDLARVSVAAIGPDLQSGRAARAKLMPVRPRVSRRR
jgi:hypothetical protein